MGYNTDGSELWDGSVFKLWVFKASADQCVCVYMCVACLFFCIVSMQRYIKTKFAKPYTSYDYESAHIMYVMAHVRYYQACL